VGAWPEWVKGSFFGKGHAKPIDQVLAQKEVRFQ